MLNTRLKDYEKLPRGKVQLLNLFRENFDLAEFFFFVKCGKCSKSIKILSTEKKVKCSNCDFLLQTTETNFFVIIPVEQQIIQSAQKNWEEISKFDSSERNTESYTDAHDGSILRNILNFSDYSDLNILSLCLNVDGANKFKSNSLSLWPIQLIQNYLPPHIRFLPQNIIMNGLFYHKNGDNELNFHEYMRPLIDELNELRDRPILINIGDDSYKLKPIITHCAIDLPAKAKIQATKQFGGYQACTYCEIPGKRVLVKRSKNVRKRNKHTSASNEPKYFVRYVEGDVEFKERSEIETLKNMLAAAKLNGKGDIDGVKGE